MLIGGTSFLVLESQYFSHGISGYFGTLKPFSVVLDQIDGRFQVTGEILDFNPL